jgi:tRNA(fMet)-specific endonuclease VapC
LQAAQRLTESERDLSTIEIVTINEAAAETFSHYRKDKKLKRMGRADLLIACIAIAQGAVLVTRNTCDFRLIPELRLENWAD